MGDRLRIVTLPDDGRAPVTLLDLAVEGELYPTRDSFEITPPGAQLQTASAGARWSGQRPISQRHDNGAVGVRLAVKGATADAALERVSSLLASIDVLYAGEKFLEWRPDGATRSSYFELRGPASFAPTYRWVIFSQTRLVEIGVTFPVAPLARGDRMDVLEDFAPRGDALYENLIVNPSFELGISNWSASAAGVSQTRSTAEFRTGLASMQVTVDGTIPSQGARFDSWPAKQGETYSAGIWVKGPAGATVIATLAERTAALGFLTSTNSATIVLTGAWQLLSISRTFTQATAERGTIAVQTNVAQAITMYFDSAIAVEGATLPTSFDGDSNRGAWTGSPHASTSTLLDEGSLDDWTFDFNPEWWAAGGGVLRTTAAGIPGQLYHSARGYRYTDVRVTKKFTTGASLIGVRRAGIMLRRLDSQNFLWAEITDGNTIRIRKMDLNVATVLATSATAYTASKEYWLTFRAEGTVLTTELWAVPPTPGGTPIISLAHQLSATDAAKFGAGIAGDVGLYIGGSDLDWTYDDVLIEPFVFSGRPLPSTSSLIDLLGIPGDAPALMDVIFEKTSGSNQPYYGAIAWASRRDNFNLVQNGDFEGTTYGGTAGWTTAAVTGLTSASTSINRVTTAAKFGSASGEITAISGNIDSGVGFPIHRRFRRGVTYTAEAWFRAATSVQSVRLRLGVNGDFGSATPIAMTTAWQRITVTWTPTADRDGANVTLVRVASGAADVFQIDGVQVYEGTTAPTSHPNTEGRGAIPAIGVLDSRDPIQQSGTVTPTDFIDANATGGSMAALALAGVGSYRPHYFIDPEGLDLDPFSDSVSVEVFARLHLPTTIVSPRVLLSAIPSDGTNVGNAIYADEWGSIGKAIAVPSGANFRVVKMGTLTFRVDRNRPTRWLFQPTISWAAGSSGTAYLDAFYFLPVTRRAASPTGKSLTGYPVLFKSSAASKKRIASDLSGAWQPSASAPWMPDVGLGGAPLEPEPGDQRVFVAALTNGNPDMPELTGLGGTLPDHTLHFAITPRWRLARDS
jgi:hypothetical protein